MSFPAPNLSSRKVADHRLIRLRPLHSSQACLLRNRMPNLPWHNPPDAQIGTPPQAYSFRVNMACLMKDDAAEIPHIGGTVLDVAESKEGEVLRSEVAAAVGLLKHQFRRGDFCHHHTLPVSTIRLSVLSPLPPTATEFCGRQVQTSC